MSEGNSEQEAIKETAAETEGCNDERKCGGNPHLPTILSVIAVLLAGYAVVSTSSNVGLSVLESKLGHLESKVSNNSSQLASLNEDVQKNRDSLVQARLKEVLLSIQEIKGMSDAGARETIAEAEKILLSLNPDAAPADEPATQQETGAATAEEAAEPKAQVEKPQAASEPAEQAATEAAAADTESSEAPADAAPEEQPAVEAEPQQDSTTAAEAPAPAL